MECPVCKAYVVDDAIGCGVCFASFDGEAVAEIEERRRRLEGLLVVTTGSLEPIYRTTRWLGPVFGEAILGVHLFADMANSVRDVVGGRSASYERHLQQARELALEGAKEHCFQLGGNAIIGMRIDYETIKGTMLMVSAQGTAVVAGAS